MKKERLLNFFLAALVAAIVAFTIVKTTGGRNGPGDLGPSPQGSFEKVRASGVIRCGYVVYPPGLTKDPNSGKISGIFPEVLEEAANNLGFKVEWSEEVGWGTMVEGLNAGRYDLIGSPVWPLSQRIKVADFSQPIYYGGAELYVRGDDHRFDADLSVLNDSKFRIATVDGEVTEAIAQRDFPKAQRVSLPQLTDLSQVILTVADGKADVTFVEPYVAYDFLKNNPGRIRAARPGNPVRLYPNTLMLKQGDTVFRRALDNAIAELINNGFVDQVLRKYEPFPGAFYRRAKPYEIGATK